MKKTYKAPLTEVVKLNVEQMLTTSDFTVKGNSISGTEGGFEKAGKDDFDYDEDLW
jgi:hypothetical protein